MVLMRLTIGQLLLASGDAGARNGEHAGISWRGHAWFAARSGAVFFDLRDELVTRTGGSAFSTSSRRAANGSSSISRGTAESARNPRCLVCQGG